MSTDMKHMIKTILIVLALFALAAPATNAALSVDTSIFRPGAGSSMGGNGIALYLQQLYNAGLIIGGVLAVGMIVIGAIYRITSAGSPDRIREGNDMIISALWGVALLFGSYLILKTVNPQILTLQVSGGLPPCNTLSQTQQKPGENCYQTPRPTVACTDLPQGVKAKVGENCLAACQTGETACGPTEDPSKGDKCVVCAYSGLICDVNNNNYQSILQQSCTPAVKIGVTVSTQMALYGIKLPFTGKSYTNATIWRHVYTWIDNGQQTYGCIMYAIKGEGESVPTVLDIEKSYEPIKGKHARPC
jgi:hypothetical protein